MIGIGAQSLLKATQWVRTAVPARSLSVVAGPAKNKVSKGEFIGMCTIFVVANFAYPVWALSEMTKKHRVPK